MRSTILRLLTLALLSTPMVASPVALIVSDGRLIGATGINVGGGLYNVEFLDGTCIDLFNGCDSPADFVFPDQASATLAAQALLDQVLLDGPLGQFDSIPTLTRECFKAPAFDLCVIATPMNVDLTHVYTVKAYNWAYGPDGLEVNAYERDNNFEDAYTTWARWSVAEPGTFALLALGLAGLGLLMGRRVRARDRALGRSVNSREILLASAAAAGLAVSGAAHGYSIPGAVSCWTFDEGSGQTAFDSCGTNDGVLGSTGSVDVGDPTWTDGLIGGALEFDGRHDYVEVPSSNSLDFTNSLSIEAWVLVNNFPVQEPWLNMQVVQKDTADEVSGAHAYAMPILGELGGFGGFGPPQPRKFGLELTVDGVWSGELVYGGMWSNTALEEAKWYYLVATYDGSQVNLYLDGRLDATYAISGAIQTNDFPVRIGNWFRHSRETDADYLDGRISEVSIYDKALTVDEIQNRYRSVVPEPGTFALLSLGLLGLGLTRCKA